MGRKLRTPAWRILCAITVAGAGVVLTAAAPARLAGTATQHVAVQSAELRSAGAALPVDYSFAAGFSSTVAAPTVSPPGANDFSYRRSPAHPYPVVLVHGTFENMDDNWQAAAPLLADHGYCVFALNYGGAAPTDPVQGTGDIPTSARQLAAFVRTVLAATGAAKVDIVGHSQGGMMPRYYIDFLGGATKVHALIGLSPSNYGTTVDGLTVLTRALGVYTPVNTVLDPVCRACVQQFIGSSLLPRLNRRPTVPSVRYTVIETTDDEVVTPYTNAFLPPAPNVTDITVQTQCPLDASDHLEISYDPVALADVLNALDPAHPVPVPCETVLPAAGPVGLIPSP